MVMLWVGQECRYGKTLEKNIPLSLDEHRHSCSVLAVVVVVFVKIQSCHVGHPPKTIHEQELLCNTMTVAEIATNHGRLRPFVVEDAVLCPAVPNIPPCCGLADTGTSCHEWQSSRDTAVDR